MTIKEKAVKLIWVKANKLMEKLSKGWFKEINKRKATDIYIQVRVCVVRHNDPSESYGTFVDSWRHLPKLDNGYRTDQGREHL